MTILDGKAVAARKKEQIRAEVESLKARGVTPGLAVVLVGDNPASAVYVRNKEKDCAECGIYSEQYHLPADVTKEQLLQLIGALNDEFDISIPATEIIPENFNSVDAMAAMVARLSEE